MSRLAFIHTSPAAIAPLMQFYGAEAPEMEITNLLDDGLLRLLRAGEHRAAETQLAGMLRTAREIYGAEAALLTCSAVPAAILDRLRACAGMPLIKIDEAMARRAAQTGPRVGVAVTFAPTVEPTRRLLAEAGAADISVEIAPGAYDALLGGNAELHDRLLLETVERLAANGANVIVLAQVSMARVLERARGRVTVPVISSLETSLAEVRGALGAAS